MSKTTRRDMLRTTLAGVAGSALITSTNPEAQAASPAAAQPHVARYAIEDATHTNWPAPPVILQHGSSTIALEPYAPNVIRISLSLDHAQAIAGPGYGFIAQPVLNGWTRSAGAQTDIYSSPRLKVTVQRPQPQHLSPTQRSIAKFFNGSTPGANILIQDGDGNVLLHLTDWSMSVPNYKDGNAGVLHDRRPRDLPFYQVGATFVSPADEHYFGLGQNQEGYLDHRGHTVNCWHDYDATAAPSVGVPFLVTNKGYGLIWDNPSKTTIEPGFNEQTRWISQVGNRVTFFVIAGKNTDEIYTGYRLLTGATSLLPKAAYGFIQCKQRYMSQKEVLDVAHGYRDRKLPGDVIVVDWFYYTKMGQFDFDRRFWPDPGAMNRELHGMGWQSMISVWPRFTKGSRYYDYVLRQGWFEHLAGGTPTNGLPYDRAGSDIDTTNPMAGRWYWNIIKQNILSQGFDALWADETEPDLPPNGSYFHIGPGTRYYNVYPLLHTEALYDGFRRDYPKKRALILSRDAYLGAQRNGTFFWSSDIYPTWDTLRRQIPTGLDFTASGLAHWTQDIGGWQYLPGEHKPQRPPLLDPSDARDNVGGYDDYPELFTRWFQYGVFLPIFRTHGSRRSNEVWSYGKQAEPILSKFLRLRYRLLPYIYSLAYHTTRTGAPYMRALFMDFPEDEKALTLRDQFMFGPAFLVAPVYEQGVTERDVYLPKGAGWYNFWTNTYFEGGQTIRVNAPIDQIPVFVRAGSIVPLGAPILSTNEHQAIESIAVYPGADASFALYDDDGESYAHEHGDFRLTELHWDDKASRLSHSGAKSDPAASSWKIELVRKA